MPKYKGSLWVDVDLQFMRAKGGKRGLKFSNGPGKPSDDVSRFFSLALGFRSLLDATMRLYCQVQM